MQCIIYVTWKDKGCVTTILARNDNNEKCSEAAVWTWMNTYWVAIISQNKSMFQQSLNILSADFSVFKF